MNTKSLFLQAVQILAEGDPFILQAAERVREETLPRIPGGAALEFVAAMEKFRNRLPHQAKAHRRKPRRQSGHQCKAVMVTSGEDLVPQATPIRHPITLSHALRVKSAEYWLKLGHPEQALLDLERLPETAKKHPWSKRVIASTKRAVREMAEIVVQA